MFVRGADDFSIGQDNSVLNEENHCLELSFVGLNALMIADCECLENMARLLDREDERQALTAGNVPEDRIDDLLDNHLLNDNEFNGKYIFPNISRNDPSFVEQEYWRGHIWGPTNFIVGEGLMRIKNMKYWNELVNKGLNMFCECWKEKHC